MYINSFAKLIQLASQISYAKTNLSALPHFSDLNRRRKMYIQLYIPAKSPGFLSPNLTKHLLVSRFQCVFFRLALSHRLAILFMFTFKWLRCKSHVPLSAAISCSLFEAITFHLLSHKISLFLHSTKLNHLSYLSPPKNFFSHIFLFSIRFKI